MIKKIFSAPVDPIPCVKSSHRRFRLIHIITFEAILFATLILILSAPMHQWLASSLTITGIVLGLGNLLLLNKYNCINLSGYIVVVLIVSVVVADNLFIGGPGTSFFVWFYIIPVITAALLGIAGLIIFGLASTVIIVTYVIVQPIPLYISPEVLSWPVQLINYSFALILILTVLTIFILENLSYEDKLISLQRALEKDREKFHYLSKHDLLTNLPNRSHFYAALKTLIQKRKENRLITVFFMDLNKFKSVNDKYGHLAGDQVLIQSGRRLLGCFRPQDVIARFGGDEFTAIIVHNKNDNLENIITNRIRSVFKHPFRDAISGLKLDFSIGVASYPNDTRNIEDLVSIADKRMYEDKQKYKKNNGIIE